MHTSISDVGYGIERIIERPLSGCVLSGRFAGSMDLAPHSCQGAFLSIRGAIPDDCRGCSGRSGSNRRVAIMKQLRSRAYRRPLGQWSLDSRRYQRTRAYGARRRPEQRGSPTITRYQEVARQHMLGTPIPLAMSLPCCVAREGLLCGRGTAWGIVLPQRDMTWRLLPICEVCIREIDMIGDHRR